MVKRLLSVLALAVLVWPAGAQDVVYLKGGDQIAGTLTDGLLEVQVETPAGTVRVPWRRIERIDRADHVRAVYADRARGIEPADAEGHFLLALWCRRQGLSAEMAAELERVLAVEPDHPGARRALGFEKVDDRWVAGESVPEAKGFVRRGGRWVLPEEAAFEERVRERERVLSEGEEKAGALILKAADENPRVRGYAGEALRALTWADVRIPLFRALADREPEVRAAAATELGRRGEREAVRPLIRTAVLDLSPGTREAAVAALREFREPAILLPFARALASEREEIRTAAAQAIGGLGDVRGVQYLVKRLSQNWGPSQRNNIQVMNQVSYIRDFDVEIAQAAQIGDPIIGVLREGIILDFQILGASRKMTVVERRALRGALSRLAGVDLGDDGGAWARWWEENRDRLLAEAR